MNPGPFDLGQIVQAAGLLGGAVFIIYARLKGWWVDAKTFQKTAEAFEQRLDDLTKRLEQEQERCNDLREENRTLWQEKVEDARETQRIAQAYLRLRDQEQ